jgi:hypothetical protein
MFRHITSKPVHFFSLIHKLLDGSKAIFPLCILIAGLPFLMTQGNSTLDFTVASIEATNPGLVEKTVRVSLNGQPVDDEEDVCHPVPADSDPSEDTSGMALHLESLVRKDIKLLRHLMSQTSLVHAGVDFPLPTPASGTLTISSPALPYPPHYPVFLVGDLPPPLA